MSNLAMTTTEMTTETATLPETTQEPTQLSDIEGLKQALISGLNRNNNGLVSEELTEAYVNAILEKAEHNFGNIPPIILSAAGMAISRSTLNCSDEDCTVPINLAGLWGYGCWCHFGNSLLKGHGDPVNDHDEICMNLQNCLRCIVVDEVQENNDPSTPCDPKTANFQLGASFFSGQEALVVECENANSGNDCGKFACICEMSFIASLVDKLWEGYLYDPSYKHDDNGGSWNFEDNCITSVATAPKTKECCGNYPNRVPFYVENRSCCEDTQELYSQVSQVCCEDGVKNVGEVC